MTHPGVCWWLLRVFLGRNGFARSSTARRAGVPCTGTDEVMTHSSDDLQEAAGHMRYTSKARYPMNMKTYETTGRSILVGFAAVIALQVTGISCLQAQEPAVSEEAIRNAVVDKPLTRSVRSEQRTGYRSAAPTRSLGNTRNLTLVETKVDVIPDARIDIPIEFVKNSSNELASAEARSQLAALAQALVDAPEDQKFLIEGHTCVLGSSDHNAKLSVARATFVAQYLVEAGLDPNQIDAIGNGEAEATNMGLSQESDESQLAPFRKVVVFRKLN